MPETAAAGAMDAIYRHQRYIYDLTRRNYLIGRDALIAELNPPLGGSVLEIGCGTARNLIRAARIYPAARFYGIDVSHEMLKTAQASIARSPMHSAIRVAHADATAFCSSDLFGLDGLDRVFISYALSMIPAWEAVIDRAVSALAPTGALHIVDFGTMATMPELPRRALRAWLAHFGVTPRDNLQEAVREAARHAGCAAHFQEGRFGYAARAEIGPKLS